MDLKLLGKLQRRCSDMPGAMRTRGVVATLPRGALGARHAGMRNWCRDMDLKLLGKLRRRRSDVPGAMRTGGVVAMVPPGAPAPGLPVCATGAGIWT